MSTIYRALFSRAPDGIDPWSWVADWWSTEFGTTPQRPEKPLVHEGWMASWSQAAMSDGPLIEVSLTNETSGVTTSFLDWREPSGRTILVEERVAEHHGMGGPLPAPSALVGLAVKSLIAERAQTDRVGQVLLVGSDGRHQHLFAPLDIRTKGMLTWRFSTVEHATAKAKSGVAEGAVVLMPADGRAPLALPAMWTKSHPEQVARRLQTEAVRLWQGRELPHAVKAARATLRAAGRSADEWVALAEEYAAEASAMRDVLEHTMSEHNKALAELDDLERRLRFLETEFRLRGELVPDQDPEADVPVDVSYSVEAMKLAAEYLTGIALCPGAGNRSGELDAQHSAAITARRAWRALRALNDYVRAKAAGFNSVSFLAYCREAPAGYLAFPAEDVAMTESESCLANPVTRSARVFVVPTEVAPGGQVVMAAHVKVAGLGNLAARLHFYDDTNGSTGKVYVGYYGPHLPLP
jgi:hypothetical protein